MIYRFTLISDEVDDFIREIQIDPEATFYDFHEAILKSAGYTNDQMTSFFICDDDWKKEKEVTLEEMDDNPEIDSWVMKETQVSELVEDEKQKLLYVFDYMTERCFFIELSEIITGKNMTGAKCTKKAGEAPKQTIDFEEMAAAGGSLDLDESFYGDQDFDIRRPGRRFRRYSLRRRQILINRFGRITICSNDTEISYEDTFVSKDVTVLRPNYFIATS